MGAKLILPRKVTLSWKLRTVCTNVETKVQRGELVVLPEPLNLPSWYTKDRSDQMTPLACEEGAPVSLAVTLTLGPQRLHICLPVLSKVGIIFYILS